MKTILLAFALVTAASTFACGGAVDGQVDPATSDVAEEELVKAAGPLGREEVE